jgi:uncharacterized membrane protein
MEANRQSSRKIFGTLLLILFMCIYIIFATIIANTSLISTFFLVEIMFYMVAGIAWAFPAMKLLRWSQGESGQNEQH